MSFYLKYDTADESDFENFDSFGSMGDRIRLRVKYTKSGTLQMIMTNITTGESYVSYLNSSALGTDLTPTKLIIGADESNENHFRGLSVEKISVK